jgi:hypothetical protein
MVVLLAGGAIYGFYNYDYLQEMMCVVDIGFFVYAYEHFNKYLLIYNRVADKPFIYGYI